jgi:hypothetical protein
MTKEEAWTNLLNLVGTAQIRVRDMDAVQETLAVIYAAAFPAQPEPEMKMAAKRGELMPASRPTNTDIHRTLGRMEAQLEGLTAALARITSGTSRTAKEVLTCAMMCATCRAI